MCFFFVFFKEKKEKGAVGESLRRSGEGDPCPSNLDFQLIGAQLLEQQEEEEELEFLLQAERKKKAQFIPPRRKKKHSTYC